ncbi:Hsp20 family protein [Pseudodesulfovibrio cashew]|uniref:Hsp20 family protein n=1 Tax=Pseudodesulfovibrio cashew TaxID=2678688 RepID=A0A6I6JEQ0_9BACT|nr:Hsp20/alpha crystallin family protein [Pseudodesulfovibrio cashew]QGY39550.1 Hsp20 family protein [Pseudodesulfovibrio cashew]
MTVSKLNPWNWFRKEREQEHSLPVRKPGRGGTGAVSPLDRFHDEFDRMVESMFTGFGLPAEGGLFGAGEAGFGKVAIKPKVDVYGTEKEYVIEADLPGVEEKDLSIELKDDVLILSAEKRHDEKTEEKGYYRVERSYGSFRRVFNIPEDADRENIRAKLTKGVLCVTMPRTRAVGGETRKIAVDSEQTA